MRFSSIMVLNGYMNFIIAISEKLFGFGLFQVINIGELSHIVYLVKHFTQKTFVKRKLEFSLLLTV